MIPSTLGDYCKWLEKNFSPEIMIPKLPIIIRLDGNGFSKWTKGLPKFDERLQRLMIELTSFLVKETNARVGYTQSDEITLVLYSDNTKTLTYNDGKKQKILSKLTAKATQFFNENRPKFLPEHNKPAIFDCRIYQAPTLDDAVAQLIWRENDAVKNSIQMLAQMHFSHNQLQNLNGNQLQDKLMLEKGINWNDMTISFKRGIYIQRKKIIGKFTPDEIERLPKNHQAKKDPSLTFERNVVVPVAMPIINKIANRVDVFFHGEEPQTYIDEN